ncbi:MAG: proline dehydrogenase family protein [Deltaproteobacteria bacterium]|nr:proline dehydrogenase family protein [Deltaproteobacteria bacterium]
MQALLVKTLPRVPRRIVARVASRYVAGAEVIAALTTAQRLSDEGATTTLALLGEEVADRAAASEATAAYLQLLTELKQRALPCNVSVKLTHIGLDIDRDFCIENLTRLGAHAQSLGGFVRLDMEDHTRTDVTLDAYRTVQQRHPVFGVVLQAMLRRTLDDIAALPEGTNVRLCKGIYREPEEIAFVRHSEVRQKFVEALEALFDRQCFVGIASHDRWVVERARALITARKLTARDYEFQMLLGVLPKMRQRLLEEGHAVRVYIPYGEDWYAYSMRRLRENPTVALHVIRAFLTPWR